MTDHRTPIDSLDRLVDEATQGWISRETPQERGSDNSIMQSAALAQLAYLSSDAKGIERMPDALRKRITDDGKKFVAEIARRKQK